MFQVLCEGCLGMVQVSTAVLPERCPICGSALGFIGPVASARRITDVAGRERAARIEAVAFTDREHFENYWE